MACRTRRRVKERLNNSNYIETSEAPEASRRGSVSNFKLTWTKTLKYSNPGLLSVPIRRLVRAPGSAHFTDAWQSVGLKQD